MKSLKVIIVLIIVFSFFGVSMVNADNIDLDGTARENISVERIIDNGVEVVVYTHLDRFIQKVHESFPEISNREIAAYISDYTGQFFPLNSDEDVSFVLRGVTLSH